MLHDSTEPPPLPLRSLRFGVVMLILALLWGPLLYLTFTFETLSLLLITAAVSILLFFGHIILFAMCVRRRAHWWTFAASLALFIFSFVWVECTFRNRSDTDLRAALPQLRALVETVRTNPLNQGVSLNQQFGNVSVIAATPLQSSTILVLSRNPDAEHGLIFTNNPDRPSPPDWVVHDSYTRIAPDCWRYHWYDE